MTEDVAVNIFRSGVLTVVLASAPAVLAALVVGLVVAFLQSLTQIQEMTLTFIPKILAVFLTLMIFFPWMMQVFAEFTEYLLTNIPNYISP